MIMDRHAASYRLTVVMATALCILSLQGVAGNFQEGEFVPTSRRAQFSAKRTHWHDLLGRHCPRFGLDKVVIVPVPKPAVADVELERGDLEYKLQISFDGEQHHTSWLTVLAKRYKGVPILNVELTRSGSELRSVKAQMTTATGTESEVYSTMDKEWQNATHWPKHLVVRYNWNTINEVDVDQGLFVVFGSSLFVTAIVAWSVIRTYQAKLTQFLNDMAAEEMTPNMPPSVSMPPGVPQPPQYASMGYGGMAKGD